MLKSGYCPPDPPAGRGLAPVRGGHYEFAPEAHRVFCPARPACGEWACPRQGRALNKMPPSDQGGEPRRRYVGAEYIYTEQMCEDLCEGAVRAGRHRLLAEREPVCG